VATAGKDVFMPLTVISKNTFYGAENNLLAWARVPEPSLGGYAKQ
jgi:hypothetical protein